MASTPVNRPPAGTFDASAWLAAWAENGGIVILAGDQLFLRRTPGLPLRSVQRLDQLGAEMLRSSAGPMIAETLARRREGEVA